MYDFTGENPADDLSFKKNDIVAVFLQGTDGWWKGELNGEFGKFPGSYVQVLAGDELKKNMRRVRFKQEMSRLRQQLIDEDKTLSKLQEEKEQLEAAQGEINEQWNVLNRVYSSLADQFVAITGKQSAQQFAVKLKESLDCFSTYNLVIDDVADCRHDLVAELNELKKLTDDKDKKKKIDKKQEKLYENIRKLSVPIGEQFNEEQALHRKGVKLGADAVQTLQAVDQLGYFLYPK